MIVASGFTDEALKILEAKKNIRLLKLDEIAFNGYAYDTKKVLGGLLIQTRDNMPVSYTHLDVYKRQG